jgi:spore coat protein U-like protein
MKKALAAALVVSAIAVGAQPAFGDDVGTVSAQVTVAAPCIQVSPGQLDFGTLGFSQSANNVTAGIRAVTATNCGPAGSLLGRGTNASSTQGTSWTLDPDQSAICSTSNRYTKRIDTGPTSLPLSSTQDTALRAIAAGEAAALNAILVMPCVGSNGAGQTMTFSYIFTATLG